MIKVSQNGITKKYTSSKLSALKFARTLSAAEINTGHHLIIFSGGKRIETRKLATTGHNPDAYYY